MTRQDEEQGIAPQRARTERLDEEDDGRVKSPSPEEVPELLGERSDYPSSLGDES